MYWAEFLTVVVVHFLAVASPGPDFALVVRESVLHGRRLGLYTALGIACGIGLHVSYSLLGLGLIVSQSVVLFNLLKWLAAGYLIYIGIQALRAKASPVQAMDTAAQVEHDGAKAAFVRGLVTNGLNPKVTLFFLALFTVVISPTTPLWVQAGYGAYLMVANMLWFSLMALVFSHTQVRAGFARIGHWFDRVMGAVLLALGIKLLLSDLRES